MWYYEHDPRNASWLPSNNPFLPSKFRMPWEGPAAGPAAPAYPVAPAYPAAPVVPMSPMAPYTAAPALCTGTCGGYGGGFNPLAVLAQVKLGTLVDSAIQAFAAFSSLPPPPALGENENTAQQFLRYQQALAEHAKKDERLRTLGAIARLLLP